MHNVKFIGAIFILSEILTILSYLSIVFQRSCINFSQIEPRLEKTMDDLRRVETEKTPIRAMKASEATYAATGRNLNFTDFSYREMENLLSSYIRSLIENVGERFKDCSKVLNAFKILDPLSVPQNGSKDFQDYGTNSIIILANHFYQSESDRVKEEVTQRLLSEWSQFKYHINDNVKCSIPESVEDGTSTDTSTDWLLVHLLSNHTSLKPFFPFACLKGGSVLSRT